MVAAVVWKAGLLLLWCWLCCLETFLCTSRVLWMNHTVCSCHHQVCRNQQCGNDDPAIAAQSRKHPLWKGLVFSLFVYSPFLQIELDPPWGGGTHKTQEADSRLMISVSSSQFPSNNLISLWSFSWFSEACIHGYPRSKLQCKLVTCKWKLASPMFFSPNYQSVFRLEQESSCQDLVALSKYQAPKKQASLGLCFPITCGNSYLYLYQTSKDKAFIPRNPSFLLPKSVSSVRSHEK